MCGVSTRAEAENTGVRELEAGPVDMVGGAHRRRDMQSNRKSFPVLLLLDFKREHLITDI